ncbi:MAG: hypothetical protein P4L85_26350 [Paludisphaera borealis]|uniref:hypothetical protein n=1 Tax=Paludisphaera borealis TaxID=1387353 RepID=UPI0028507716|nr:hypothetical protein [Paludisphaera borealis]MDR3622903.1 hypothetical protein [Paludisphaera borealis]
MASNSSINATVQRPTAEPNSSTVNANADPRFTFRSLLARHPFATLRAIAARRGLESEAVRASTLAGELTDELDSPAVLSAIRADLDDDARLALSLFGLTDSPSWPLSGLKHALSVLGATAESVVVGLLERGLLALDPGVEAGPGQPFDFAARMASVGSDELELWVHPALSHGVRIRPPSRAVLPAAGPVGQIREPDGLEPILRLAALWQRTGAEPLRRTQQGTLYKRDRERIEEDPVLSGPVSDALAELPAMATLWLGLARRVGLVHLDPGGEFFLAASAEFWTENAVHLPQMIASGWLGLRTWLEWAEPSTEAPSAGLPLVFLRPALLLWLASLAPDTWVTLDDLAEHLTAIAPGWDRTAFTETPGTSAATARRASKSAAKRGPQAPRESQASRALGRVLLGGGYAMGLVRVGEEKSTDRKAVQLTPLGRYVLGLGPPPPPRPTFEHFLFVQPNLEVIAYRQGLTPPLIGRLSRFAWWTKIGAAMELKLTQESVALGLEWNLSPSLMLEILSRHSQRALPGSVKDAIDRWASRRERVTMYTAATLIEFGAQADRDRAATAWTEDGEGKAFIPVGDRFLLVENAQHVPTSRISTTAVRDYRLPPERCVSVEADGVTLALDPSRSDLLIDAELARFADEEPTPDADRPGGSRPSARRFQVTAASLARAFELGMNAALLADWFQRRTGGDLPPAVGLMVRPALLGAKPWKAQRRLVLNVPTAELLEGVLQHPATRSLLGDRLGPVSAVVPEDCVDQLRAALKTLGVEIDVS